MGLAWVWARQQAAVGCLGPLGRHGYLTSAHPPLAPPPQTHINDIMMKRYSKAKAAQEGGADLATGGAWDRHRLVS